MKASHTRVVRFYSFIAICSLLAINSMIAMFVYLCEHFYSISCRCHYIHPFIHTKSESKPKPPTAPSAGITITFPFVCFAVWLSASFCQHPRGRRGLLFSPSITSVHYMYLHVSLHPSRTPHQVDIYLLFIPFCRLWDGLISAIYRN